MTSTRKLFVGPRVRRLREQQGWNQSHLAQRLSLSLSYVSQIENNQRPVTAGVLLKLAEVFGGDVSQFSEEQDRRQLAELDCALHDQTLRNEALPPATLARMVEQAPELVEAFLALYQRHGRLKEEYEQTVDRFYGDLGTDLGNGRRHEAVVPLPHEEVRDYFNRRNNYIDTLDTLAERFAHELQATPGQRAAALRQALREHCGVEVQQSAPTESWLRRFDPSRRRLLLLAGLSDAQQCFQLATQYALLRHADAIDAEVAEGGFTDAPTQALARQGLAHYFAGGVLLPYGSFLGAARECRYDIELLQQRFEVSFETVCHRLSTLQRPQARGVPFYFVRLDQAGNISKRQSATAFHFARHGGACPAVACARGLCAAGAHPHAGGRDARRHALLRHRTHHRARRRRLQGPAQAVRHRPGLRDLACARAGLCRRHRGQPRVRGGRDRPGLPGVSAPRLRAAGLSARGQGAGGRERCRIAGVLSIPALMSSLRQIAGGEGVFR